MTDETERPGDTARRYAGMLIHLEKMVDAELERVRRVNDLIPAHWWQFYRRGWLEGVGVARVVTEMELWKIKSAFYKDPPS